MICVLFIQEKNTNKIKSWIFKHALLWVFQLSQFVISFEHKQTVIVFIDIKVIKYKVLLHCKQILY